MYNLALLDTSGYFIDFTFFFGGKNVTAQGGKSIEFLLAREMAPTVLWAQDNGSGIGPSFGPILLKSVDLPPGELVPALEQRDERPQLVLGRVGPGEEGQ